MKILFLIRSLEVGGAERQLATLANGLVRDGHEVLVAVFYGGGSLEADLVDVPLCDLEKKGRWDLPGFLLRLRGLIADFRPDLLHSYLGTANLFSTLFKRMIPDGNVIWGLRASDMDLSRYGRINSLHWRIECALSSLPKRIIANSRAGLDYAAKCGFPRERMTVIPNGIDTDRFKPAPEAGMSLRTQWGIPSEGRLVGHVGRLDPMKDHTTLLQAFARITQEDNNVFLACAGDGPAGALDRLRQVATDLGVGEKVLWLGQRQDLPEVYNAFDLLCLSSAYGEGFPNVLGEAMACGVPCVATAVGDSEAIIGPTGECVPPGRPVELAHAVARTLQAPPQAATLRTRIVENYNNEALIRRTEETLATLS